MRKKQRLTLYTRINPLQNLPDGRIVKIEDLKTKFDNADIFLFILGHGDWFAVDTRMDLIKADKGKITKEDKFRAYKFFCEKAKNEHRGGVAPGRWRAEDVFEARKDAFITEMGTVYPNQSTNNR